MYANFRPVSGCMQIHCALTRWACRDCLVANLENCFDYSIDQTHMTVVWDSCTYVHVRTHMQNNFDMPIESRKSRGTTLLYSRHKPGLVVAVLPAMTKAGSVINVLLILAIYCSIT